MSGAIVQGTQVRLPFATVDATGALFDATAISAVIMAPDATKTTVTLAGGGIIRTALGSYYLTATAAQVTTGSAGAYTIAVTATVGGFVTVEVTGFAVDADPTL